MEQYFDIDDDLLNHIHEPVNLSKAMSYEDAKMSQNQKMIISYDLLDLDGKYGFLQNFTQAEIHGYFKQMKKYSTITINEIIDNLDYKEHFNDSKVKGILLSALKEKIEGKKNIDANLIIYHFALEPTSKVIANRSKNTHNARVYFLLGKFGIAHILFFDPYHEIDSITNI